MSIVTFWNSGKEQTGKTLSIAAISTYMAIEHNYRILVVSTGKGDKTLDRCFWEEKKVKKNLGLFGPNTHIAMEEGISGLIKIMKSNKLEPENITNYTKIVFKDRLEILQTYKGSQENYKDFSRMYPEIMTFYRELLSNDEKKLVIEELVKNYGTTCQLFELANVIGENISDKELLNYYKKLAFNIDVSPRYRFEYRAYGVYDRIRPNGIIDNILSGNIDPKAITNIATLNRALYIDPLYIIKLGDDEYLKLFGITPRLKSKEIFMNKRFSLSSSIDAFLSRYKIDSNVWQRNNDLPLTDETVNEECKKLIRQR